MPGPRERRKLVRGEPVGHDALLGGELGVAVAEDGEALGLVEQLAKEGFGWGWAWIVGWDGGVRGDEEK